MQRHRYYVYDSVHSECAHIYEKSATLKLRRHAARIIAVYIRVYIGISFARVGNGARRYVRENGLAVARAQRGSNSCYVRPCSCVYGLSQRFWSVGVFSPGYQYPQDSRKAAR